MSRSQAEEMGWVDYAAVKRDLTHLMTDSQVPREPMGKKII